MPSSFDGAATPNLEKRMAVRRRIRAGLRQGAVRFVAGYGCGSGLAEVRVVLPDQGVAFARR